MKKLYSAEDFIADEEDRNPAVYPQLYNISAAFIYRFMPRPIERERPEFLYLPVQRRPRTRFRDLTVLMSQWNMAWEQAQLRFETNYCKEEWKAAQASFPALRHLEKRNVYLLPDTVKRFDAYAPLYAMLPLAILTRFGLPPIRRMTWPVISTFDLDRVEPLLPVDFRERLSRAFAAHVWPLMKGGSPLEAFSKVSP